MMEVTEAIEPEDIWNATKTMVMASIQTILRQSVWYVKQVKTADGKQLDNVLVL